MAVHTAVAHVRRCGARNPRLRGAFRILGAGTLISGVVKFVSLAAAHLTSQSLAAALGREDLIFSRQWRMVIRS